MNGLKLIFGVLSAGLSVMSLILAVVWSLVMLRGWREGLLPGPGAGGLLFSYIGLGLLAGYWPPAVCWIVAGAVIVPAIILSRIFLWFKEDEPEDHDGYQNIEHPVTT
jgi:hypothetical protein